MTNDVARMANAGILLVIPVSRIAAIIFIAVSLLAIDGVLGLLVLLGAPAAVWLMGVLSERYSRDTREYQGLLASTVGRATDLIGGYRVVKGVGAEAEVTKRYQRASQETLVGAKRNAGFLGRFLLGSSVVSGAFVAVVMGLVGWFAVTGRLSIGELIAAVGLARRSCRRLKRSRTPLSPTLLAPAPRPRAFSTCCATCPMAATRRRTRPRPATRRFLYWKYPHPEG